MAVPVATEYLPAAQLMQAPSPTAAYVPATQTMHKLSSLAAVSLDAEFFLAAHLMQVVYVPTHWVVFACGSCKLLLGSHHRRCTVSQG